MRLSTRRETWGKWHKESKGKRRSEEDRFWIKVDIRGDHDCWPWLAGELFNSKEGLVSPPRYVWGFAIGEKVSNSIRIGHRIRSIAASNCCNPRHLYATITTSKATKFIKNQFLWTWNWSYCLQKFYNNVDKDSNTGCWNWVGDTKAKGYGRFVMREVSQTKTKYWASHRLSWMLANNSFLDDGDHIHHTCRNKGCINPDHLVKMSNVEHGQLHGKEVQKVWDTIKSRYKDE